jgi:hypothetical protein
MSFYEVVLAVLLGLCLNEVLKILFVKGMYWINNKYASKRVDVPDVVEMVKIKCELCGDEISSHDYSMGGYSNPLEKGYSGGKSFCICLGCYENFSKMMQRLFDGEFDQEEEDEVSQI